MTPLDLALDRQPVEVDFEMVIRQPSFAAALGLCQTIGGVTDQEVCAELDIDAGVWSRIKRTGDPRYKGQKAYFPHDKLIRFMQLCGNRAPLIWLEHSYGDDPRSVRRYQSEVEARLEIALAELAEEKRKNQIIEEWEARKGTK